MHPLRVASVLIGLLFSTVAWSAPGDGVEGRFDASDKADPTNPSLIWRSYSVVDPSVWGNRLVSTRVAVSGDRGKSFIEMGVVNRAIDGIAGGYNEIHETSSFFFDPSDPDPNARWKIVWMHYFQSLRLGNIMDPSTLWIGMKSAPNPWGPWSAERKFIAGTSYNPLNPLKPGFPLLRSDCTAISEPSVFSLPTGFLFTYQCAKGDLKPENNTIRVAVVTHAPNGLYNFADLGTFLTAADATRFRNLYSPLAPEFSKLVAFGAPELFAAGTGLYLSVTPMDKDFFYRGCVIFQVTDVIHPNLVKAADGTPIAAKYVEGIPNSFRGACTYTTNSTGSGIVLSQIPPSNNPRLFFTLVNTQIQVPYPSMVSHSQ